MIVKQYSIPCTPGLHTVNMPYGSKLLRATSVFDPVLEVTNVVFWALVDDTEPIITRVFSIVPTDEALSLYLDVGKYEYFDTVLPDDEPACHIFHKVR